MDREKRKGLFIQRRQAAERASAEGRREWLFVPSSYSTTAKGYTHTAILFTPQLQTPHGRCDRAFAEGCQKQPLEFVVWLEALKFCANANCVAGALTSPLPSSDPRFGLGCEQHFCPHPTDNTKCLSEKETVLG